jgi:lysozyme
LLVVGTMLPIFGATPARAQSYTLGVDVSHWQEENGHVINWQKVADSGHVFAFHKATEGSSYSDPRYAGNRTDAGSIGIPFGAYHFARPSGGTIAAAQADAMQEAQHFLAVAQPAGGDLLPVLDLESSGDLPVRRLKAWVQSWLDTVIDDLGVQPIIYSGPNFWRTSMGDTTEFADQGFPLWLAHYTSAASPSTPAANWGGNGWAFWQWTSCASVPGINGCADEDRFAGSDLTPYKIPGAPLPEPTPDPATPPMNQSPPTVTGDTEVGSVLTAQPGTWQGSTPQSYSYAWHRCDENGLGCGAIFGGTKPTYELAPADYGHRLKVTVTATNSAGSSSSDSAPTSAITDAVAPGAPTMTAPDGAPTLARKVRASWTSDEAGVEAFDLRYRATARDKAFSDYVSLKSDSADTEMTLPVEPGTTYCFSARSIDEAGNRSEWSTESCTAVPLDDRGMSATGFKRTTGSSFYLGTASITTRMDAALSTPQVRVQDLFLVATRCRGCGKVAVSFNGRRLAVVDLSARTTRHRALIRIAEFASTRAGNIRIKALSRGLPVRVDGLVLGISG